ncbi:MAG: hypothetical protein QMD71_09985, partial [bacterium]|nr:hypothetical protein [bacterium]
RVYYEEGKYPVREIWKWEKEDFERDQKLKLINPEDVERFAPPVKSETSPSENYEYVIIPNFTSRGCKCLQFKEITFH